MTQDDVIRLAKEAGWTGIYSQWVSPTECEHLTVPVTMEQIKAFAKLVAEHERERIKQANKPELEKCNAYIKELEKAVLDEREACANVAQKTVCDIHIPTGVKIYGTVAAQAIRARGQA